MSGAERIERDGMADFQRAVPAGLAASYLIELADIAGAACSVVGSQPALTFAIDEGKPVATGALHVTGGGGWLGFDATLPAFRRRGAQNALLAGRIDRARELGLTTLVASTSAGAGGPGDSYRNIERAGFRFVCLQPSWLSPE